METPNLEFFKLDDVDRKVLIWLLDHVQSSSVKSWIEFIADDYKRRKNVEIDVGKLFEETEERI